MSWKPASAWGPIFTPRQAPKAGEQSALVALAALRASMDMFDEAGIARLRAKSVELTGHLESVTPRDPERRGAQLSIRVRGSVHAAWVRLSAAGVVCDWREPDILRVARVPLYNTAEAIDRLVDCLVRSR